MSVLIAVSAGWSASALVSVVSSAARGQETESDPPANEPASVDPVRLEPSRIDFGGAAPGETIQFGFQLINDSEQSIAAVAVRPNCDCTQPIGFRPRGLFSGESMPISAQITAPDTVGESKGAMLLVMLKSGQVLPCSLRITAIDPRLRRVQEFLKAYEAWGQGMAQRHVSFDARKWFLTREGEGTEFFARGAWADWDDSFGSTREIVSIELDGDEVIVISKENNDFYRLIERALSPSVTRYWFDEQHKILGKVYLGRAEGEPAPPDRLGEVLAWLDEHDPGAAQELMPGGEIDPSLENAERWKGLLIEWRRDLGLEPVTLTSD